MKKALVFGGSGFLGSHVVDALFNKGFEVTIFDLAPSRFLRPEYKMIVGSTSDRDLVFSSLEGMDYVYHFSGIAGIADADADPVKTADANFMSTLYILDACVKHKVSRLMYASTVYVYSEYGSFYRCSKQAAEIFIENYHQVYDLNYTIMRYGSLYGRRSNHFNFIGNIIRQALQEKKITRKGNGEEIRDYINVMDAARMSVELLNTKESTDYVSLTGNQTLRVKDLLLMVKEIFGNSIDIEYLGGDNEGHYMITPYAFKPVVARKYTSDYYLDLGQGVLDCIHEIYDELEAKGHELPPIITK